MSVRYRQVPRFGKDGVRKFSANSSEMKRMAAHDFEDLLQVSLYNAFREVFIKQYPVCNSRL
jgi:hypothetical protein